jgi:beta-lactamase class A
MNRREFVVAAVAALAFRSFAAEDLRGAAALEAELPKLEKDSGGRLGVAVLDTATGAYARHRADERFPMCSTFKLLAVAAVLKKVDGGEEHLERKLVFEARDLVPYSPVAEKHVGSPGISVAELCEAAMTVSDNTAANLLLTTIGGPQGVTAFARTIGDTKTRLDRNEPSLNESVPGDPRDTTTPGSMVENLRSLVLGSALSAGSRERLTQWLLHNHTGDERLRAGVPTGWRVGDKTGSGRNGSTNDVAVIWPANRKPVIVAVYLTETNAPAERRNGTIAGVGRAVARIG